MAGIGGEILAGFATPDIASFETREVAALHVDLRGIPGDRHYGFTREAGARERWYPKGESIRSSRQLTLVSREELAQIAGAMDIPFIDPRWLGANVLVQGITQFTRIPWGTRLFCGDGAVLVNEGENAPCRFAGAVIARAYPERSELDMLFVKAARNLRGIVASVERSGVIVPGPVRLRIPPQHNWTGGTLL